MMFRVGLYWQDVVPSGSEELSNPSRVLLAETAKVEFPALIEDLNR
jgi:hypothetical protein